MLQFLQTGRMLYVLGAICLLGIISKLVTSSLYKRLIKETGNMALTKNKNLKALKQKTENLFLVSHGIRNPDSYIEKQLYGFQFLRLSLDHWDNLSLQAMILCFLTGGAAAFGAYWYRCDSYYIVLYGAMGVLFGLLLVLVDNGANVGLKRQQLADCLVDYVENSPHFYKNVDNTAADYEKRNRAAAGALIPRGRETERREAERQTLRAVSEQAAGEDTEELLQEEGPKDRAGRFYIERTEKNERAEKNERTEKNERAEEKEETAGQPRERQGARLSVVPRRKEPGNDLSKGRSRDQTRAERTEEPAAFGKEEALQPQEDEIAKSIEYLRQSLEQIAAGRDLARRDGAARPQEKAPSERVKKEWRQEDLKLLGELLQEYLT